MQAIRQLLIEIGLMVAAGALLAALGPFDSYAIGGFADRLAYWLPATLIGYVIFRSTGAAVFWLSAHLRIGLFAASVAAVLVAAVPGTLAMALFGGYRLAELPPATRLFPLYVNVALVGAVFMALFVYFRRVAPQPSAPSPARPPQAPGPAGPPLLKRLSPGFAQPLVALEMEDHYIRAHGREGRSELILMRMRDAVAELAGTDGEQVHRSWWVARDAVRGKRRDGRSWVLLLDGGLEAPVARDRAATLKEKGWL